MSFSLTLFWYLYRKIKFYFPKNESRSYLFLAIVIKHYFRISLYLTTTLKLMALLRKFTPSLNETKFGKNYFQIEWAFPSPFFVFSQEYSISFFIGRPPKLPVLSYFTETNGTVTKIYSLREWDKIWKKLFPNRMSFFLTLFCILTGIFNSNFYILAPKLPILSYFTQTDGAITKIYSPRE